MTAPGDARTSDGMREAFIDAMRQMAASVNIVTVAHGGMRAGFTCTAAMSLSADPPHLALGINRTTSACAAIIAAKAFAVNTLAETQADLTRRFAGEVKSEARFEAKRWHAGITGAPVLHGAAAVFECEVVGVHRVHSHDLVIGAVLAARRHEALPLIYADRRMAAARPLMETGS